MTEIIRTDLLIEAIVRQAANDYRYAKKLLEEDPDDYKAMGLKIDCKKFFQSKWFNTMTGFDGFYILSKLDQEEGYIRISDEITD